MAMIHMIEDEPVLGNKFRTRYSMYSEPEQVKAIMLTEKAEFAILPATTAAIMYQRTGKYILAAIPVRGSLYLCSRDSSIQSWEDLRGIKIHLMAKGMTPDVMFGYLAQKNGLDPEADILKDYSFSGHIELANALAAGIAETAVISEPMVSLVRAKHPEIKIVLSLDEEWNRVYNDSIPVAQTAVLVRKDFAEENPLLVNEYLELLETSIQKVNSHPSEAAKLIVKHKILPDEIIAESSIPLSNMQFGTAENEMSGINEYFKVFLNFNPLIIGGKLPDEGFYYKKEDL